MTPADLRRQTLADLGKLSHDPYRWVKYAYPWGVPGTVLADKDGPDEWQTEQLQAIGHLLQTNPHMPILDGTSSGHGIGKSTEVCWINQWAITTRENTKGVITANTDTQLRTKTWAEMSKWYNLLLPSVRELFELEATSMHSKAKGRDRTWRIDAIPWSERNTEAFAGLHNEGNRIILTFDEASAIPDIIWETAEGALTDSNTEILWLAFGNPTRNTGRFREAIEGRFRHLWRHRKIDSRNVAITNKAVIESWRETYGEDSDFFRVRVRGEFPRAGSMQFIGNDLVQGARKREPGYIATDPMILGVDVARFGDDRSVIAPRRGRDARSAPWTVVQGLDTMQVAAKVVEQANMLHADAVFIDQGGIGAGVLDRVRQIGLRPGCMLLGVDFGGPRGEIRLISGDAIRVSNNTGKMWAGMKDWLPLGSVPDDDELETDLTGREYGYDADNAIQLESKKDMKKRKLASPDKGDALGLTFFMQVAPRMLTEDRRRTGSSAYDIHGDLSQFR